MGAEEQNTQGRASKSCPRLSKPALGPRVSRATTSSAVLHSALHIPHVRLRTKSSRPVTLHRVVCASSRGDPPAIPNRNLLLSFVPFDAFCRNLPAPLDLGS